MEEQEMTEQVHKRLIDEQVKMVVDRFIRKELSSEQAMQLLGLKRSQFFEWVRRYRESEAAFTIQYHREGKSRGVRPVVERRILQELKAEKALIDDPSLPVRFYNYSYIRDQLSRKYGYRVSLPTIIDRAKKTVFTSLEESKKSMIMKSSPNMPGS